MQCSQCQHDNPADNAQRAVMLAQMKLDAVQKALSGATKTDTAVNTNTADE